MKLTEAQLRALNNISDYPQKSGRFHAHDGIKATTISSLFHRGLVETGSAYSIIGRSIYGQSWCITEAGRALLSQEPSHAEEN